MGRIDQGERQHKYIIFPSFSLLMLSCHRHQDKSRQLFSDSQTHFRVPKRDKHCNTKTEWGFRHKLLQLLHWDINLMATKSWKLITPCTAAHTLCIHLGKLIFLMSLLQDSNKDANHFKNHLIITWYFDIGIIKKETWAKAQTI